MDEDFCEVAELPLRARQLWPAGALLGLSAKQEIQTSAMRGEFDQRGTAARDGSRQCETRGDGRNPRTTGSADDADRAPQSSGLGEAGEDLGQSVGGGGKQEHWAAKFSRGFGGGARFPAHHIRVGAGREPMNSAKEFG